MAVTVERRRYSGGYDVAGGVAADAESLSESLCIVVHAFVNSSSLNFAAASSSGVVRSDMTQDSAKASRCCCITASVVAWETQPEMAKAAASTTIAMPVLVARDAGPCIFSGLFISSP